ncbi:unnamed protein product [Cuscuta campestris]|uniref:Bifunctional inhibitor/plant lipid transfer protein/seed storage helical domain-containing protein n=1 Tax=Cuscuta campestris TaxID=132261 RepID=A0A484MF15_9ASTE|nr:unnamed protein product [Cuscuta campestris]
MLLVVEGTAQPLSTPSAAAAAPATCDIRELAPCGGNNSQPSGECCAKLKAQDPSCLCQYAKNPSINVQQARAIAKYCNVQLPKCSS